MRWVSVGDRSRVLTAGVTLAIMVLSVAAVSLIPFGPFLGLDIHSPDVFHDCVARNDPYLSTGAACGDIGARDMLWPPPLYWFFVWTRLLPLSAVALLWAAAVVIGGFLATLAWAPRTHRSTLTIAVVILLMLQYPLLFSMERGNNDVLILVLWTLSAILWVSGRAGWSGVLAGMSVALKLYPAIAVAVVGVGLVWWAWRERASVRRLILYAIGGMTAMVIAVLPLATQWLEYLTDEFQQRAEMAVPISVYSHSLDSIAPGGMSWLLSFPLLAVWMVASARRLPTDPALIFAGGLAISTYYSSTTYDYNLVTAYPLILLLFVRAAFGPWRPVAFLLLVLGLVSIIGHRQLFAGSDLALQLHVALQWSWLVLVGLAAILERVRELPSATSLGEWKATKTHERRPETVRHIESQVHP